MGRLIRQIAPSAPVRSGTGPEASSVYAIKLITPLIGGGTAPRKLDPVPETLIRGPSIRGHLRWWFRATAGSRIANTDQLHEAESVIFGKTGTASPVRIFAKVTNPGRPVGREELNLREDDRLFPVFPKDVENIRLGIEFELTVSYPAEAREAIETALWAWTNFGGIGSKVRRGCGALYCSTFRPRADQAGDIYLQNWTGRVEPTPPGTPAQTWSRLAKLPLAGMKPPQEAMTPMAAWRAGIEMYRGFRQQGPAAHGITSFDALGYASQGRMASPVLLRPVAWADGTKASPMVVPLMSGASADTSAAVDAVLAYFRRQHKFKQVGEY